MRALRTLWSDVQVWVLYLWAYVCWRLGRFGASAEAYRRVLRRRPDDAHAQFYRAYGLCQVAHRRRDGIAALHEILERRPSASGFFLMGCGLQFEGRHEEAVAAYRDALRLEPPGTSELNYNLGTALRALRRRDEAVDALQQATHLDPSMADAWSHLGITFAEQGQWSVAAACLERVMRLEPTVSDALNLAEVLSELSRFDEAELLLRRALGMDPNSVQVKASLAWALCALERQNEAIAVARDALTTEPRSLEPRFVLAWALAEMGQLAEALAEAERTVDIASDQPEVHGSLGGIRLKAGDGAGALRAFDRALELESADVSLSEDRVPGCAWARIMTGRAAALSVLARHSEALELFEAALGVDPTLLERYDEPAKYHRLSQEYVARVSTPSSDDRRDLAD